MLDFFLGTVEENAQRELARLQREGARADKVAEAERKLAQARANLTNIGIDTEAKLKTLNNELLKGGLAVSNLEKKHKDAIIKATK